MRSRSTAAAMALPEDLEAQVRALLEGEPEVSWDQARVLIIGYEAPYRNDR
jgi:hypothetical protein